MINILAISGSLRENSSNNAVIKEAAKYAGRGVNFIMYKGLGALPHFDDSKQPSAEVQDLRTRIRDADGVLICSPEYAFGVPGSLKNALDWTVSSGELAGKPLALITAATGGDKAYEALLLTFTALSCRVSNDAKLLIRFVRSKLDENGDVKDPATRDAIKTVVAALERTIKEPVPAE